MNRKYSSCYFCKGNVKETQAVHDLRWKGKLFVFEQVPTGVCQQCGEKFLKPEILKAMDHVFSRDESPVRTVQAPVFKFHFPYGHSTGLRRTAK